MLPALPISLTSAPDRAFASTLGIFSAGAIFMLGVLTIGTILAGPSASASHVQNLSEQLISLDDQLGQERLECEREFSDLRWNLNVTRGENYVVRMLLDQERAQ